MIQKGQMKYRIWAALLTVYLTWGLTYLAIRFAVQTIPPFTMAATRFIIPGVFLYSWRRMRGDPAPKGNEWRAAAIVGALLLVGGNGLVSWAEQYVPSGITALLIGSAPIWMVLIDYLRPSGKPPGIKTVFAIMLGFAGIILLISPSRFGAATEGVEWIGIAALILAAIFWAGGSVYNRDATLPKSALLGTGMEMLVGGTMLLGLGLVTGEWSRLDPFGFSKESILGLLYLIVFGSIIGFSTYIWLLRNAPTPLVSTYAYVNPLIAIFMGAWLASETLSVQIILSAVIIVASVVLINFSRTSQSRKMVKGTQETRT
ncbi:MAG: EamA family transporter [Anaerolineales bacterium]|nr:EamA family transporter [Anaerolineales bacterium]